MIPDRDIDGSSVVRLKVSNKGETMHVRYLEFETSVLGSLYNRDKTDADYGDANLKFYDASDVELTTQAAIDASCVKTVLRWEPTFDFEVIGGSVRALVAPANDVRLWCTGVPDIPAGSGGSKELISGCNFKFMNDKEKELLDGRTPKYMAYNGGAPALNIIQKTVLHPVAEKCKFLVEYEVYKV